MTMSNYNFIENYTQLMQSTPDRFDAQQFWQEASWSKNHDLQILASFLAEKALLSAQPRAFGQAWQTGRKYVYIYFFF